LTAQDVTAYYEGRLRELRMNAAQARSQRTISAVALAIAIALSLILGIYSVRGRIPYWWPSLVVPVAAWAGWRYQRHRRSGYRTWRLKQFHSRAIRRINGDWIGNGSDGEEFIDPDHVYSSDLNVFGEGSLFELLCIARTANGRRGLAGFLLNAPAREETLRRQDAVRELSGRVDLREQIALLGDFESLETKWETFEEWLNSPPLAFSRQVQVAALISSVLLAVIAAAGLLGLVPWATAGLFAFPLLVFQSIPGLRFRKRINAMIASLRPVSVETQVLRDGLRLLETTEFRSAGLRRIADRVRGSAKSIGTLERLLNALNERNKEWFYAASLVLLAGTQLCMAVENWRIENGAALRMWLDVWAEFEALNSLANYAYENPGNTFPEFSSGDAAFEAEALGHPLIAGASCIRNDIQLNRECRFYVVSGSNMSGKSTLLRTIGLNAVLALAGAPVRARALRLSPVSICASLSVLDSLLAGKSKFFAEMERLRQTLEIAGQAAAVLFLIDEILSGTNSRDRRVAAESVVRTLIEREAIGVLSTHDLALSEIAGLEELHGRNVHTGSCEGGGPMDFDYLLKPGVTREANALAIARMAGVPVPSSNAGNKTEFRGVESHLWHD
jgi:hypothetical protein